MGSSERSRWGREASTGFEATVSDHISPVTGKKCDGSGKKGRVYLNDGQGYLMASCKICGTGVLATK